MLILDQLQKQTLITRLAGIYRDREHEIQVLIPACMRLAMQDESIIIFCSRHFNENDFWIEYREAVKKGREAIRAFVEKTRLSDMGIRGFSSPGAHSKFAYLKTLVLGLTLRLYRPRRKRQLV